VSNTNDERYDEPYPAGSVDSVRQGGRDTSQLLELAARGDESSWLTVLERVELIVRAQVVAAGLSEEFADDVVQLAVLRLAQWVDDPPLRLDDWLVGLTLAEVKRHGAPHATIIDLVRASQPTSTTT
jgi:hypothetical protein